MSRVWRRLRQLAVVAVTATTALVAVPGPAGAHAYLVGSAPADGTVVAVAPAQLQMRFSESVEVATMRVDVVGSDGRSHSPTRLQVISGGPAGTKSDVAQPVVVVVSLPPLRPDAYRVSWETVSSDDLHRTSGVLVFGVQHPVTAAGLHETAPGLRESGLRWLLFLFFSLALGGTALARLYRPSDSPFSDPAVRRSTEIAAAGALAAAAVSLVLLAQQMSASGESLHAAFRGSYGSRWLVREAGLALLAVTLLLRGRLTGGRRWLRAMTVVAAAVTATGSALLGHAGAGRSPSPTRVGADALHLLAAATWAGTVLVAAMVVVPWLRTSGGEAVAAREALRRFLVPAVVCVGVMAVTGVYLASGVIGSVDALLLTTYGRLLLAKLGVVAIAGWLALLNSAALHPALGRALGRRSDSGGRPRRLVPEAVAAAVILALSATLTSGQPAREPQLVSAAAERVQPVVDGAAADLQETLSVRPNLPGTNVVVVGVFDTRRPSPGRVVAVDVTVGEEPGRTLHLSALGDGRWSSPLTLSAPGTAALRVVVHRSGLPDQPATYPWVVGGSASLTHPALVSTAPLARTLRWASAGLAVLLALVSLIGWRLRRRTPPAEVPGVPQQQRRLVSH